MTARICPICDAGPVWRDAIEYYEHLVACRKIVNGLAVVADNVAAARTLPARGSTIPPG